MLDNKLKEIVKNLSEEEISTLISLANQEREEREEAKERKYLNAIVKVIQEYLDNVGDLTFHVDYEDEDGHEGETDIVIDRLNPPACDRGTIYI